LFGVAPLVVEDPLDCERSGGYPFLANNKIGRIVPYIPSRKGVERVRIIKGL